MAKKQTKTKGQQQSVLRRNKDSFAAWLKAPRNLLTFIVVVVLVLVVGTFLFNRTVGYFQKKSLESSHNLLVDSLVIQLNSPEKDESTSICSNLSSFKLEKPKTECSVSSILTYEADNRSDFDRFIESFANLTSQEYTEKEISELYLNKDEYLSANSFARSISDKCYLYISYNSPEVRIETKCSEVDPAFSFFR